MLKDNLTIYGDMRCRGCSVRSQHHFCDLPQDAVAALNAVKFTRSYPKGSIIFLEGQPAHGAYILCDGKVKLTSSSPDGRVIILDIVSAGGLMGLSAVILGGSFESTASTMENVVVNYVSAADFRRFLREHPAACINAVKHLSTSLQRATRQVCTLGLGESASEKLASLLLDWSSGKPGNQNGIHFRIQFTHEDMARMIGTSRETVTRALSSFRDMGIVTLKGSELIIHDRDRLRSMTNNRPRYTLNSSTQANSADNAC